MNDKIKASAFAPGHLTGLFRIFELENGERGSTGAGLNTELGVRTEVKEAGEDEHSFRINTEPSEAAVSRIVLRAFESFLKGRKLLVDHTAEFPIGFGLGMSGAGALSLSLAVNSYLGEPCSREDCLEFAKGADIEAGCGLGDAVAAQFHGFILGQRPYPSKTASIISGEGWYLTCAFFDPIATSSIINDSEWKARIDTAGKRGMERLYEEFSPRTFIRESRVFAEAVGLASEELQAVLRAVPEASMAMLGQTAFVLTESAVEGIERLQQFSDSLLTTKLASQGARVLS